MPRSPSKGSVKQLGTLAVCSECDAVYTGNKLTMNMVLPCAHKPRGFMAPSMIGSNLRDAQLLAWAQEHAPDAFGMLLDDLEEAGGSFDIECGGQGRLRLPDDVAETEPACRVCGCTESRACPGGCWWVEEDLCSTCHTAIREGQLTEEQFFALSYDEKALFLGRAKRVTIGKITHDRNGRLVTRYIPRIRSMNWIYTNRGGLVFKDWKTPDRARRAGQRMLTEWRRRAEEILALEAAHA